MSDQMPDPKEMPAAEPEVDQLQLQQLLQQIRDNQNFAFAILGGAFAAAVGAVAWAAITYATEYQSGIMAIGIGFLVGYAVQKTGRGIDLQFGIVGAVLSLLGCVAGNLLAVCVWIAKDQQIPVMDVVSRLDVDLAWQLLRDSFSPMDVLFYGLALYYGYKLSFYKLSEEEIKRIQRPGSAQPQAPPSA